MCSYTTQIVFQIVILLRAPLRWPIFSLTTLYVLSIATNTLLLLPFFFLFYFEPDGGVGILKQITCMLSYPEITWNPEDDGVRLVLLHGAALPPCAPTSISWRTAPARRITTVLGPSPHAHTAHIQALLVAALVSCPQPTFGRPGMLVRRRLKNFSLAWS